jgi:hypothetical protein
VGLAGCCAAAPSVNIPIKAPASSRLRGDEQIIMEFSPLVKALILARASAMPAPVAFLGGSLRYFPVGTQSEIWSRGRHSAVCQTAGNPSCGVNAS